MPDNMILHLRKLWNWKIKYIKELELDIKVASKSSLTKKMGPEAVTGERSLFHWKNNANLNKLIDYKRWCIQSSLFTEMIYMQKWWEKK